MYALTIFMGPACFQLLYRTEEPARLAKAALHNRPNEAFGVTTYTEINDDFGHEMTINLRDLSGFILEDMEKTKAAHVDRALHQQRVQMLAQKTAENDPGIRASRMMGNNGPILSPFPQRN